jgi:hypothetical protein
VLRLLAPVPYLPVKQEFHPKRNAARQKLASLTKNRFKDLASDVYYELLRRNPSFRPQQEHVDQQEVRSGLPFEAPKRGVKPLLISPLLVGA